MKEEKKITRPLIAIIARCVCVLMVAVLVLTQACSSDKVTVTDPEEIGVTDPEPEDKEDAEPDDEFSEEDKRRRAPAGALDALTPLDENAQKYNFLLMGVDAAGSLTDVIMIYQIDTQSQKISMMSIPRDTKVTYNGRTEKINAVHAYGSQKSDSQGGDRGDEFAIEFISDLTGLPIHHYMCINLSAFRQIIDALGGFDYDVPRKMDYDDDWQDLHIHLSPGMQHLDGAKAEQLVRFRRYTNGDIDRVKTQQNVLKALIAQKVNPAYIPKVPEIFRIVRNNVSTDMTLPEIIAWADDILAASGDVSTCTAEGSFGDAGGVSYWVLNNAKFKQQIRDVFGTE